MYGKSRVNVKVERGSTFTFTRELPVRELRSLVFALVIPIKCKLNKNKKIE